MEPVTVVAGGVSVLDRSDVDTDQIMPKQFLKRVERTGFGEFLFFDWAKEPGWHLPRNPILATGRNFGSGSSREHAPWGLQDYGFRAVVAPSFADIFYSNCTKIGLLPVVLEETEVQTLMAAGEAVVDLERQVVAASGLEFAFDIHPETRRRLLGGLDDIAVTLQQGEALERYERERGAAGTGDHRAVSAAGPALGRRGLRAQLGSPAHLGPRGPRPPGAARRRDCARRRLRERQRSPVRWSSACLAAASWPWTARSRWWSGRGRRSAKPPRSGSPTSPTSSCPSRWTSCSPMRSSTGSPTVSGSSAASSKHSERVGGSRLSAAVAGTTRASAARPRAWPPRRRSRRTSTGGPRRGGSTIPRRPPPRCARRASSTSRRGSRSATSTRPTAAGSCAARASRPSSSACRRTCTSSSPTGW
ncbi:MAG: 3-isopropylmalate dehydratase small subunit [Thermoleophilaceae bacterium]